ncbi:hypothetical protein M0802_010134 [Mischocyttarus mexicanus]|nr:hypothetical protein M0802_010134 [Mischocyttarus mexicanus]
MAFLRTVPRCCAGKKILKRVPLPVVRLRDQKVSVALVRLIERGYASTDRVTGSSVHQPASSDQAKTPPRQIDPLDLKFNDPVAAFKSKTTKELVRAYAVYQICSIEYVVENNMKVSIFIEFMKLAKRLLGEKLFTKMMKATFYGHFVAGEDEIQITPVLDSPNIFAGASMGVGITAVKLTALGRPQLLLQLSEVIMRARQYMSDVVGGEGAVLAHHAKPDDFKKKFEEAHVMDAVTVQKFLEKIQSDKEGYVADKLNVRIMIDAEQTYFQPAISRLTLEMMRKYNTDKAVVFNTYQTYLQEAYNEVKTDLEQAERQNFYFGAKIVRGAYIEQERARAAAMGYPDPTNPTYEATTESYHRTLMECLRRMKQYKDKGEDPKKIGIMVASHNEDTVRFAIEKMKEIGISPEDKVICFGQLLGMCDYITFPLGQSGYSAYKYIPYGPVKEVLPYLSRRAQENRGILKKIRKEKQLLWSEITRRLVKGQLFYKPKGNYTPV